MDACVKTDATTTGLWQIANRKDYPAKFLSRQLFFFLRKHQEKAFQGYVPSSSSSPARPSTSNFQSPRRG
jgi:hypothetical protein